MNLYNDSDAYFIYNNSEEKHVPLVFARPQRLLYTRNSLRGRRTKGREGGS